MYVVATPIGNLGDITLRALDVLREVDGVLAEDTRRTATLLRHHGISATLTSLHEHNERGRLEGVVARLAAGESIAIVSDAGTPLLSDPGFLLVRAAAASAVPVVPVPGPSAITAALSVAGLPTDRFVFEGFLPARPAARLAALHALRSEPRTMVIFEAPHRVDALLADLTEQFGPDREAVLARELTKLHEEVVRGTLAQLHARSAAGQIASRGEFVVLVRGADLTGCEPDAAALERLLGALLEALPMKQAVNVAVRATGVKRNRLYQLALGLKGT